MNFPAPIIRTSMIYGRMARIINHFLEIDSQNTMKVSSAESRILLAKAGIVGEIISPGHSEDSVSLVIDERSAFTGDLPGISSVDPNDTVRLTQVKASWMKIQTYKVKIIYPGHGSSFIL